MGFQLDCRSNLQISTKLTTNINNNFSYLRQATTLSRMKNFSTSRYEDVLYYFDLFDLYYFDIWYYIFFI